MGIHSSKNKLCSLFEAVSQIEDGSLIAVGGNLSAREPMAIIREMICQGKHDMHNIGGAHGIDVDLMCAGGVLKKVQNSYVGFEADFGLAPNYRRLVEQGRIESQDTDCVAILTQLRASVFGVPFMPMPLVKGTDILKLNQEFKTMMCPYTDEEISILPALKPDWAIIHAHKSDKKGNIRLFPPYFSDLLVVEASRNAIVSVEEIVSEEEMDRIGANIPYYEVTAVVEVPFGAHPTSCYPDYSYDREHISEYVKLAKQGEATFEAKYLDRYVRNLKDHQVYTDLVGGKKGLSKLTKWNEDHDTWKQLLMPSAA
jgi:glutaconate CoA-transferase subunit A